MIRVRLLLFLSTTLCFGGRIPCLHGISYEWEGAHEMEILHNLFLRSFLENYQRLGLTNEDLATDNIEQVLNDYWEVELQSLANNSTRWIVAKTDDEIVGYASFNIQESPHEIYLQLLCVKPAYQGQGVGKSLLYSIFQIESKVKKLSMITRRINTSAIGFYKKLGFEESSEVDKKANIDKTLCIQLEKSFCTYPAF
jgi:ribosomal protein S18 acetylase RimI-like enzyme